MVVLPPNVDVSALLITNLLNRGEREKALELLEKVVASGRAREETLALADYLRNAGPARQRYGAKYRWPEIGADNDEMLARHLTYANRLAKLGERYGLTRSRVKDAIAQWNRAKAEIGQLDLD